MHQRASDGDLAGFLHLHLVYLRFVGGLLTHRLVRSILNRVILPLNGGGSLLLSKYSLKFVNFLLMESDKRRDVLDWWSHRSVHLNSSVLKKLSDTTIALEMTNQETNCSDAANYESPEYPGSVSLLAILVIIFELVFLIINVNYINLPVMLVKHVFCPPHLLRTKGRIDWLIE